MKPMDIETIADVAHLATGGRAVFLSAGIAKASDLEKGRKYAADINSRRVAALATWLTRYLVEAGFCVIFGGQPAITPIVLRVANELPDGDGSTAVYIFQSRVFEPSIPEDTWRLADWARGQLVWSKALPPSGARSAYATSLTFMRRCMVRAPGMSGAIFLGGMDGLDEEIAVFEDVARDAGLPAYVVATTGGAAEAIYAARPDARRGGLDAALMTGAYPAARVAAAIVDDLEARALRGA